MISHHAERVRRRRMIERKPNACGRASERNSSWFDVLFPTGGWINDEEVVYLTDISRGDMRKINQKLVTY
jgi:hypothetical protein